MPDDFPAHPEFAGSPLLVGDRVLLDGEGDEPFVISQINVVGYGFDGRPMGGREREVWLEIFGHTARVITLEDVVGRMIRPDSKGRSAGYIDKNGTVRYG